jgi:hypothetical protein
MLTKLGYGPLINPSLSEIILIVLALPQKMFLGTDETIFVGTGAVSVLVSCN